MQMPQFSLQWLVNEESEGRHDIQHDDTRNNDKQKKILNQYFFKFLAQKTLF
jgi:hypothetical protein